MYNQTVLQLYSTVSYRPVNRAQIVASLWYWALCELVCISREPYLLQIRCHFSRWPPNHLRKSAVLIGMHGSVWPILMISVSISMFSWMRNLSDVPLINPIWQLYFKMAAKAELHKHFFLTEWLVLFMILVSIHTSSRSPGTFLLF